jgi:hypothetical protein
MWERLQNEGASQLSIHKRTFRTKVPGGWLVMYQYFGGSSGPGSHSTVFVPDLSEQWEIESKAILWEKIDGRSNPNFKQATYRLKVPAGWIVRDDYDLRAHSSIAMVFVSDTDHKWVVNL